MSLPRNYDVIVVGAGPAGSTLAYELARAGISVLVIEKSKLPRYKCCGGGITFKTTQLLYPEISDVFEDSITGVTVTYPGDNHLHKDYGQPLMYTVMRDRFDYALAKRAEEAGAILLTEQAASKISVNNDCVEVSTNRGSFRAQFVVGADGAGSTVAREVGLKSSNSRIIAIETEVRVSSEDLAKWRSRALVELGRITSGYAWVFPKSDHLSIGIGCTPRNARHLKQRYREFLDSLKLEQNEITRRGSAFIPVCTGPAVVNKGRVALLGDAAGLADPLTGEGIYNAILSARLAASAIKNALANGRPDLDEYTRSVEETIVLEMKLAYTFSKIFTLMPQRLFTMIQWDERMWRGCGQLLLGERNYTDVKNRLNSLGGIYNFIFHR